MVALVSRISNVGVYSTNATTGVGIFDEVSLILGGSISFNGSTQYISVPSTNIGLSGYSFTLETWIYLTGYSAGYSTYYDSAIFSGASTSANSGGGIQINLVGTASSWTGIQLYAALGATVYLNNTFSQSFNLNTWYHVALTRTTGGTFTLYINGNSIGTYTNTNTWTDTSPYTIGYNKQSGYAYYFPGDMTNFRIVGNSVVYSSNFTPSTSALTSIAGTLLLLNVASSGTYLTDGSSFNNTITANAAPIYSSLTPLTVGITGPGSKKVLNTGTIQTTGILDETSIAGSATAMSEYPNGNVAVSGYFDEVTGGLVTNGLLAYIDASKQESYVRSGTNVFDLVNPANPATINGAVTWVANGTSNASSYWWWPSQSASNYINGTIAQNYLDVTIVFQPDYTLSTSSSLAGLIGSSTDATSSDKSLRLINVNGTGPWKTRNPDNTDGWASSSTTYYINGTATTTDGASLATGWNILGGYRTNQSTGVFAGAINYFLGLEGYSGEIRDFRGNIAAVAFYNRQLSAGEQINNYNYFAGRFGLPYIGR